MGDLDRIRALGNYTLQFVGLREIVRNPNNIYWCVISTPLSNRFLQRPPGDQYGEPISILAGNLNDSFTRQLGTFINYMPGGHDGNFLNFSNANNVWDTNTYFFIDPFQRNWDNRKDYIGFTEGTPGASGHISQYLHNDLIQRAVATYMGGKKSRTRTRSRTRKMQKKRMRTTYRRTRSRL